MKAPGLKTQHRVSEFAVQMANQYYDVMVTLPALLLIDQEQRFIMKDGPIIDNTSQHDELIVQLSGKYSLVVTNDCLQSMREGNKIHVQWKNVEKHIKKSNDSSCLDSKLVGFIIKSKGIQEQH